MIYFISDTHFNHKGSLLWDNGKVRPQFANITEMNNHIIDNWNKTISTDDEVYFLGDFAYKCSINSAESIFWQLNGKKHLIKGNHDYKLAANFINCWESISELKQIDYVDDTTGHKQEFILCHYPMVSWRHKEHGSIHLHGHTHGSIQELNKGIKRYDVSVEVNNYTPISILEIIQKFKNILDDKQY